MRFQSWRRGRDKRRSANRSNVARRAPINNTAEAPRPAATQRAALCARRAYNRYSRLRSWRVVCCSRIVCATLHPSSSSLSTANEADFLCVALCKPPTSVWYIVGRQVTRRRARPPDYDISKTILVLLVLLAHPWRILGLKSATSNQHAWTHKLYISTIEIDLEVAKKCDGEYVYVWVLVVVMVQDQSGKRDSENSWRMRGEWQAPPVAGLLARWLPAARR